MLNLEEKDYDLNFLCSFTFDFQMLKEILIKLAKSNLDLQNKLKKLEKSNNEKDKRLSNIEDHLNILYIPDQNSYSDSEQEEDNNKKEEKKEKEDKNVKVEEKEIKMDENEKTVKPIIKKETKFEKEKDKKKDNEEDEKLMNSKRSLLNKKSIREFETRSSIIQQYPQVSHETIKSLLKLIRENAEKIGKMEKNLTKKVNKAVTDFEKNFNDLNVENTKEHKAINEKLKYITDKLYDYNDKMDGIIVKTAPLDTLSIFRDNGNGNIDATKVMVKMLEEKVNKRIEIIEKKNKEEFGDENAFKQKIKELEELINQINKELSKQNGKNETDNNGNNYDEEIQELKDLIDNKYNDVLKIIEDLSNRIKNGDLMDNKLDELLNKMKSTNDNNMSKEKSENQNRNISGKELGDDMDNNITDLRNRIKEMNKKVNDIDSYFKNLFNNSGQDIGELKRKVKEMDSILEKKITKDDLKALENKSEEYNDAIQFLQDSMGEMNQSIVKISENNPTLMKRIETLTHEVLELKGRDYKDNSSPILDINRFVDEKRLKEIIKNINKTFDEINMDKNSLWNSVKELHEIIKLLESKERILKLEDDINTRFNDFMDKINKKFVEKIDIHKYIKNMELKLKLMDNQQKDADSWILAKQPIGCFNCASCEANIKKISTSNEYIPWNKYPQGDRQYHIGQGFSRLLQKIGNDNNKSVNERKEISSENDLTKTSYFNNLTNLKNNNSHFFFRVNNREAMKDELADTNFKHIKTYKLPHLKNKRKKNPNIPLTDEENDINNNSMDNSNNNSPKIVKIKKKSIIGQFGTSNSNQNTVDIEHHYNLNSTSVKSKSKLERIKSLPSYE